MPSQKPFLPWIVVSLLVVSAAAMPMVRRVLSQPAAPPRTLTELAELLAQEAPALVVVPVRENNLDFGIYICTQALPRDRLFRLHRNFTGADKWQGVVYCEMVGNRSVIQDDEIQTWGEHGLRLGPLLFFGDPALLHDIRKALCKHGVNNSD